MPQLFQVDAFTRQPFAGNPAAVCLLEQPASEAWMQQVAAEMNLAETAFVQETGIGRFHLRWFTPTVEVELCGHATLATSHVLWQSGRVPAEHPCVYDTLSGQLTATRQGELIELDFPAAPTQAQQPPSELSEGLGVTPVFSGLSTWDWLVELESAAAVRGIRPDFEQLHALGVRGVIVTAADESAQFDFVSRFFAPGAGIDEDPVTGSAHCALGPYWQGKTGKREFSAFQASSRGGHLQLVVKGDRVLLRGQAVTVFNGQLVV